MGVERGIGFRVRTRSKDTYITSVKCGKKYHSREKDPGVAVTHGGSWDVWSRGHSDVFEDKGALLMTSVSSIGCGRKVWVVQE